MTDLELSESFVRTIVTSLARVDTYASRAVLRELQRQGVVLGVWVERELNQREIVNSGVAR